MHRVPITVSFDALDTLIQITHGLGFQYRTSYTSFLLEHGVDLDASCPNATCATVQELALKAIRDQVRADRAAWTHSADPKEMPIGGGTDEELRSFWARVLRQTFTCATLYDGAAAEVLQRVKELWSDHHNDVRRFEDYVLFDQFGSTKAHSWYPEGLRTLQCVRKWNQERMSRDESAVRSGLAEATPMSDLDAVPPATAAASPVLFLAAPPFVVSNMDPRIRGVFMQLGAFEAGESGGSPLLSRIITARDAGYAKPSPVGILTGVRDIAASYRTACESGDSVCDHGVAVSRHVHVGDADADRVACERAGCHYVQCDPATGVTWGLLQAKLQELEVLCGSGHPGIKL
ncbi:conserved hypothetical protein [Leishmania mexicana MHOM/GT/2001/U1103]|uniref:Haloacid dehalogenase-like hydrolase n=1 Tax=Leishmania mexicana (strain MHOM/GT/2001/U1103) TaxID=929439 RepID=E9B319_LEIMU|nr:conserved hypothetical protein [Leishmania mexicana MHOM/GT/2001/U1103]CBZ29635.1 conserved hypothetical protein [Leishmania mexicana MHOM/GT/2001/U1103]